MKALAMLTIAMVSNIALEGCGGAGGNPGSVTTASQGLWIGTTNANRATTGLVFSDGTFYFFYSAPGDASIIAGVVQGSGSSAGNTFSSTDAKDFNLEGDGVLDAIMSVNFTPKQSFNGTATYTTVNATTFTSNYDAGYETKPLLATLAGKFTGQVALSGHVESAAVTVLANGVVSGNSSGCSLSGSAAPRTDGNAYNISITFGANPCIFANQTLTGVAYFNSVKKQLYAAAPNAARTDGFLFVGSKP